MTPETSDYRLPRVAAPRRYDLRVAPHVAEESFEGDVVIELEVVQPTRSFVLNAVDLDIGEAALEKEGGKSPLEVVLDPERERVAFVSPEEVAPGSYVLTCSFAGRLETTLRGLYASRFRDDDGEERVIASTHFEPADARRAFPCFDEPDLKAVFSVTLDVEEGLSAVSNAPVLSEHPLEGGARRVAFEDTMPMSTYLVAYAVGPFEATEPVLVGGTVPLRVLVPKGKLALTSFALEVAEHAVSWFEEYFGLAYPAQKLDLVAIPDFAMGAMENLGCVTFREQDLLCDPERSSVSELIRVAEVIEHEIAHMWFGDLVTMKWWNGIWLNEAFATFMSLRCLDSFRPEWERWAMFGTEKNYALETDALHATRPIEFEVHAPDEAEAMFDELTYLKGGSVLRMVEQYLGEDRFREGVRAYLREHAYGNTETTDLWDALEQASSGEPVRAMLDSWVFQGGFPLVTVRSSGRDVVLEAGAFSYLESARPGGDASAIGTSWLVPVLYEDRPSELKHVLLRPDESGTARASIALPERLLVVNATGSGTYRLRYDGELLEAILAHLDDLSALERFNLVADTWACTVAGRADVGDFLALVSNLSGEDDPNVWAIVSLAFALIDVAAATSEGPLASFVRRVVGPAFERYGFEPSEDDSPERERTRSLLLRLLGTIGQDDTVRAGALERFRHQDEAPLPAPIAMAILSVVAWCGSEDDVTRIIEGYRRPTDPQSENRHLIALTRVTAAPDIERVIALIDEGVKAQDVPIALRYFLGNREAGGEVWRYVKENLSELEARLAPQAVATILSGVADLVVLGADGCDLYTSDAQEFLSTKDLGGHQKSIDQALERQVVQARFASRLRPELGELLEKA